MKKLVSSLCAIFLALSVSANIHLPEQISDHMVLQQQTQATLWGWAEAGNTIDVVTSWGKQASAVVDKAGYWEVKVETPTASYTPQTITFLETPRKHQYYNPDPVRITDVLIGEVWLGGGQSNMEMPLQGFWQCPINNSQYVIATAGKHAGHIRYCTIKRETSFQVEEECHGSWQECNAFNAPNFGATAYFFAELLEQALQVPVGIINCSWGGTRIEAWLPREILSTYKDIDLTEKGIMSIETEWMRPLLMYNHMLYPLRHYTVRGFLWYQGCSNIGQGMEYANRQATMIRHWRELFGNENLPFYFVEIGPYEHGDKMGTWAAELREAQWATMTMVPHCAGVPTNDLVESFEYNNIHPGNKQDVGYRLAYLALAHDYGFTSVHPDAPQLESYEINGNEVTCYFSNAYDGWSRWAEVEGFEVYDQEGKAYKGQVKQVSDKAHAIVVYSDEVQQPKAVSYCFRNFMLGNMQNARGLSIVPFRTDK